MVPFLSAWSQSTWQYLWQELRCIILLLQIADQIANPPQLPAEVISTEAACMHDDALRRGLG